MIPIKLRNSSDGSLRKLFMCSESAVELCAKAKKSVAAELKNYINGKLGVLIDGTGHKYDKIAKKKRTLEG